MFPNSFAAANRSDEAQLDQLSSSLPGLTWLVPAIHVRLGGLKKDVDAEMGAVDLTGIRTTL
jgi:hypothetical protein